MSQEVDTRQEGVASKTLHSPSVVVFGTKKYHGTSKSKKRHLFLMKLALLLIKNFIQLQVRHISKYIFSNINDFQISTKKG